MLDRALIIRTNPYTGEEVSEILQIRATAESVQLAPSALSGLCAIHKTVGSLRYVMQLISVSDIIRGRTHEPEV